MDQDKLYELIDNIPVTLENAGIIEEIKDDIARKKLCRGLTKNRNVRKKKRKESLKNRE